MIGSIVAGGVSLFLAVSAVYLFAHYSYGAGSLVPQTAAFATWIFTHIFLALNMRSDREPLVRLGLLSNPPMILWGASAIGLLLVAANVPPLQQALRLTYIPLPLWLGALAVALAASFWMEIPKVARGRG